MAFEGVATLDEIEVGETLLVELAEPICLVRLDDDDVRAVHDTGESIGVPDGAPIPVYACRIENGAVLVDLDRPQNGATPAGG